jgi:tRNA pseudouridine32 synthase/23S rRNA pseudouridine746 synthase
MVFVAFEPQPESALVPTVFPTPFKPGPPHALVHRAAIETQAFLDTHEWVTASMFRGAFGGKMIGVLVLRHPDGRVGYLRAFAGRLGHGAPARGRHREGDRWNVDGFVPPAFDLAAFEALWGPGAVEISALDDQIVALQAEPNPSATMMATLEDALSAQQALSRALHERIHALYRFTNVRGEAARLRDLFEPRLPPGGAGDCAAPKLLAHARTLGARPLAMGEFWWGDPPPGGGRQHGVFYPACRSRCAKILPFMLEGIECEPVPDFGMKAIGVDEPRTVHEDESIIVVDKPAGLLSVRGRGARRQDSVETRLQRRAGLSLENGPWPRLAHRLDLATSGLLVAAKDKPTLVSLQRQFSARSVSKRYIAVVRGVVENDAGVIDLPLSRDLDDRPRQIHDARRGKKSVTEWSVLARSDGTTRIAFHPITGRTHQLRLHAAHASGLGAPIVGDWLYGFGGDRLMLHADTLAFDHPRTGERMRFTSTCPF